MTKFDNLRAKGANAKVSATFPSNAAEYYGGSINEFTDSLEWVGGELLLLTTDYRLYMNTATSGFTATWARLADAFATSTTTSTTTSTSTSSSTSTSTSTSSTTTP